MFILPFICPQYSLNRLRHKLDDVNSVFLTVQDGIPANWRSVRMGHIRSLMTDAHVAELVHLSFHREGVDQGAFVRVAKVVETAWACCSDREIAAGLSPSCSP